MGIDVIDTAEPVAEMNRLGDEIASCPPTSKRRALG